MFIKYLNEKEIKLNLEDIDIHNFSDLSQIYSFTTENIAGYFEDKDFKDKNILTVAASGDHIINAFYRGAKHVDGFDINYLALIYTELKLVALQNLKYHDFITFFMINEKNDIKKNKRAFDYITYRSLRKYLRKNTASSWEKIYQNFGYNGYELRNSYIFNNEYDNNKVKFNSNLYLKDEISYNFAKENIKDKDITLINASYRNINLSNIQSSYNYNIILMSNISDYIKSIYNVETNYLEEYIKEIINNFKNKNNKVVCAYLYDIKNTEYRSEIDNPIYRREVFERLQMTYREKNFNSVIDNCIDSVIII